MNNTSYRQPETEIDLTYVMWRLLSQWKAILLVAVLAAALVCGANHFKDVKAYNAEVAAEKEAAEQSDVPADERITDILESLPEDERGMVGYMVGQKMMANQHKEYTGKSILFNTDPTNQRVLSLTYDIDADNPGDLTAMTRSYMTYINSDVFTEAIKPAIDSDAENIYISELVQTEEFNPADIDSANNSAAFKFNIVLTEDADADAVENVTTSSLKAYRSELSKNCPGNITKVGAVEAHIYNNDYVGIKTNTLDTINNINNNIKNAESTLSDEQKKAVDDIVAIRKESAAEDADMANPAAVDVQNISDDELKRPGWSKKYAVLGFVLGCFAYAAIYLVWLITRGCINTASDMEIMTGTRIIGEFYEVGEHRNLLQTLLHSSSVEKLNYRDKLDKDKQIEKMVVSVEAICEHESIKSLAMLNLAQDITSAEQTKGDGSDLVADNIIKRLTDMCKRQGVTIKTIDRGSEFSEKDLSTAKDVLILADRETRNKTLWDIMAICSTYGTNICGAIFVAEL